MTEYEEDWDRKMLEWEIAEDKRMQDFRDEFERLRIEQPNRKFKFYGRDGKLIGGSND